MPLANYTTVDLNDGGTWLTYVDVSRADPQPGDEELLGMFSPRYFNEQDAFRKHDLVATELPPIKANLQRYANQAYYALPFGDPSVTSISMNFSFQNGYDFNSKSFLMSSGQCWSTLYGNRQNVLLDLSKTGSNLCQLPVHDEAQAKQIEQLRAAWFIFTWMASRMATTSSAPRRTCISIFTMRRSGTSAARSSPRSICKAGRDSSAAPGIVHSGPHAAIRPRGKVENGSASFRFLLAGTRH